MNVLNKRASHTNMCASTNVEIIATGQSKTVEQDSLQQHESVTSLSVA